MARRRKKSRSRSRGRSSGGKTGFFKKNGRFRLIWRILFWITAIWGGIKLFKFGKNKIVEAKSKKAAESGAGTTGQSEEVKAIVADIKSEPSTASKSKVSEFFSKGSTNKIAALATKKTGAGNMLASKAHNKKLDAVASKMA